MQSALPAHIFIVKSDFNTIWLCSRAIPLRPMKASDGATRPIHKTIICADILAQHDSSTCEAHEQRNTWLNLLLLVHNGYVNLSVSCISCRYSHL